MNLKDTLLLTCVLLLGLSMTAWADCPPCKPYTLTLPGCYTLPGNQYGTCISGGVASLSGPDCLNTSFTSPCTATEVIDNTTAYNPVQCGPNQSCGTGMATQSQTDFGQNSGMCGEQA